MKFNFNQAFYIPFYNQDQLSYIEYLAQIYGYKYSSLRTKQTWDTISKFIKTHSKAYFVLECDGTCYVSEYSSRYTYDIFGTFFTKMGGRKRSVLVFNSKNSVDNLVSQYSMESVVELLGYEVINPTCYGKYLHLYDNATAKWTDLKTTDRFIETNNKLKVLCPFNYTSYYSRETPNNTLILPSHIMEKLR